MSEQIECVVGPADGAMKGATLRDIKCYCKRCKCACEDSRKGTYCCLWCGAGKSVPEQGENG